MVTNYNKMAKCQSSNIKSNPNFKSSNPPSPRWGDGKGEGKFQIFLVRTLGFEI
jgi:hypothetical protein